jgi:hypothetical protein
MEAGFGQAAAQTGQPYTAYRIISSSSGDFPSGWSTIGTNVLIYKTRMSSTAASTIESALLSPGTMFFSMVANMSNYLLGDVFVLSDAPYVAGVSYGAGATSIVGPTLEINALALAWHPPVFTPVGARISHRVRIYRPQQAPERRINPDGSQTYMWRQTEFHGQPLILSSGKYSFGAIGATPSWIPAGISGTERPSRGANFIPAPPGTPYIPRYFAYLPPLPGYEPTEGDRLLTEDGARYIVVNPYKQEVGFVGAQMSIDRVISQDG